MSEKKQDFINKQEVDLTISQFQHFMVEKVMAQAGPATYHMLRQEIKSFAGIEVSDKEIEKALEEFDEQWQDAWPS